MLLNPCVWGMKLILWLTILFLFMLYLDWSCALVWKCGLLAGAIPPMDVLGVYQSVKKSWALLEILLYMHQLEKLTKKKITYSMPPNSVWGTRILSRTELGFNEGILNHNS